MTSDRLFEENDATSSPRRSSPRTVLLLGGTGFVGTNLVAELARAGHHVLIGHSGRTDRVSPATIELRLDATDALLALVDDRGVDTVVHLASGMIPSSSLAVYAREQARIVAPTMRLAAGLAERGVRLVFLSSGGTVYGVVPGGFASEDDRCAPINFYGHAKLGMERDLRFLARTRGLRHLIVRPSNPYGPHQPLRGAQGLVSVALGKVADGQPLEVWGDGTSVRDYIYIDDLVASIRGLIEQDVAGVTLNLGSGVGHSLLEVVEQVRLATGRTLDLLFRPARKVDVPRLVLDVGRVQALGLHRTRSLANGISAYAATLGMADA